MLTKLDKYTGIIVKSFPVHGSGFIKSDECSEDIFYHISKFIDVTELESITVGAKVKFNIIFKPEKGYRAINIEIVKDEVETKS